jgi:hypothetical protein
MTPNKSRIIVNPKLIQKLTQIEFEKRMQRRANEINKEVAKIEKSQRVTKETMDLEFTI